MEAKRVLELEAENEQLRVQLRQLSERLDAAVADTHRQYRRDVVLYRHPQPPARQN